jgi:hypothetical protein
MIKLLQSEIQDAVTNGNSIRNSFLRTDNLDNFGYKYLYPILKKKEAVKNSPLLLSRILYES